LVLATHLVFGVTCASAQSSWTPAVDTFGNSRAQYLSRDQWECRELAMNTSGTRTESATRGALRGGMVGAAGGAAIGAALGNAGRGAAVGAAAGGLMRGVQGSNQTEAEFRRTFSNCLRARGHNVLN
jgi:outer membrane lipoprotein SlyB